MHWWIIVLIVLGSLFLLLFFLLLFGRARIRITLKEKLGVSVRILFFRKRIFPNPQEELLDPASCKHPEKLLEKEERRRRKKLEQAKKKRQKQPAKEEGAGAPAPKPNLVENLGMISSLIKKAYALTKGRIGIRFYRMHLSIGTGDAAETAICYGVAVQSVSLLLEWIDTHYNRIRRDPGAFRIEANFVDSATHADVDLELSVGLLSALRIGLSAWNVWKTEHEVRDRKAAARMRKKARRAA